MHPRASHTGLLALQFNHPRRLLFASKDALLVQHEDPSYGAQAEDEGPRYYSVITQTLCNNIAPALFAPVLHHLATYRAEAHSTICPARRLDTLRVVVLMLSKAMGVRRL